MRCISSRWWCHIIAALEKHSSSIPRVAWPPPVGENSPTSPKQERERHRAAVPKTHRGSQERSMEPYLGLQLEIDQF